MNNNKFKKLIVTFIIIFALVLFYNFINSHIKILIFKQKFNSRLATVKNTLSILQTKSDCINYEFLNYFNQDVSKINTFFYNFKYKINPEVGNLFLLNANGKVLYSLETKNVKFELFRKIIRKNFSILTKQEDTIINIYKNQYIFTSSVIKNIFDEEVGYLITYIDLDEYLDKSLHNKNYKILSHVSLSDYEPGSFSTLNITQKLFEMPRGSYLYIRKNIQVSASLIYSVILLSIIMLLKRIDKTFKISKAISNYLKKQAGKRQKRTSKSKIEIHELVKENHNITTQMFSKLADKVEQMFSAYSSNNFPGESDNKAFLPDNNKREIQSFSDLEAIQKKLLTIKTSDIKMPEGKKTAIITDDSIPTLMLKDPVYDNKDFIQIDLKQVEELGKQQAKDDEKNKQFTEGKTKLVLGKKKKTVKTNPVSEYIQIAESYYQNL